MRFEYIVLLIIAFNVISAVVQNRAKKKRAQELARSGGTPPSAESEPKSQTWYDDEEEEYQTPQTETQPRDDRRGWEDRRVERPERVSTSAEAPYAEKMPSMGRDILDQLARDLGLKIPRSETPAPAPVPASPPPRETRPVESEATSARKERDLAVERVRAQAKIREWESLAASRVRAPERSPSTVSVSPVSPGLRTQPVAVRTAGEDLPFDLRDPRRLREALVVKEILDAPLSRRPRR